MGVVKDNTLIKLSDLGANVFLIHGKADNIVPFGVGSPFNNPSFPATYGSNLIYKRLTNLGKEPASYFLMEKVMSFMEF